MAKRDQSDALIKINESKYSEVLKRMKNDAKLTDPGADVRGKYLAKEVLGKTVEVRFLAAEVTFQCENLDEVTDTE